MIGEINKKKNDYEAAIRFYLRGISQEPSYIDNYVDLGDICELLNETDIGKIFFSFAKVIAVVNAREQGSEEERIIEQKEWDELNQAVSSLRFKIQGKKIGTHFLRAVNVL